MLAPVVSRALEPSLGDGAVGVIDVGSNSVRLVLYERASRAPTILFNEKVLAGLGDKLTDDGRLDEGAMARALAAIRRFRLIADSASASKLTILATAAARVAANGAAFIAAIEREAGVPVRVLSGPEEAEMAGQGVLCGFWQPDGIVADLGGGSLELIDVAAQALGTGVSHSLGTLRLMAEAGGELDTGAALAREALAPDGPLSALSGRTLYIVGGTWRALMRLHMARVGYPFSVLHHYSVESDVLRDFCELILREGAEGIDPDVTVPRSRRTLIPWGALVLKEILDRGNPKVVIASALGVREGLMFAGLPEEERRRDCLIAACEELSVLRARSPENAAELVAWSGEVFAALGVTETVTERRLRSAACYLSDIGWRAHPDYRGEQALAAVSNMALYGIDHPGRGYLAAVLAQRYKAPAAGGATAMMPARFADRAALLAAIMRLAYVLAPGVSGILPLVRVERDSERLVFRLGDQLAALNGERPRRRARNIGRLVGLEASIEV